jgi:hypothetical protein
MDRHEARSRYEPGLPAGDRQKAPMELTEQLRARELDEERAIRRAARSGQRIRQRENVRPEVVLALMLADEQ